ncbi:RluA family pseudouridine synthase [Meridianimarinicoccus aquatilis]|uniref:Pseudouridine synthase n=1 Tax=Meridianimarinicoccus aquatilis TaxID=2552766 RepID=A0A4R6AYR5_9RHOB|nr:RluA family pseudouridine synthase [Fluviibacterium aquatile]TDL89410.1 RluA family pseudouridine synthase [Fluviibacterium aquatile]
MSVTRTLHVLIAADPPPRIEKALARDVPLEAALSRTRITRLLADGAVRRGDTVLNAKSKLDEGDEITIEVVEAQDTDLLAEDIPLHVVFEDDDLIVVNKPAGMVVHPAPGSPSGTLVNALMAHCGDTLSGVGGDRRPGIVHRIDKDTSGLLVVAKSDRAHHGLAEQFAAHSVARHYRALVHGVPDAASPRLVGLPGTSFEAGGVLCVTTQIGRHRHDRQKQAVLNNGGRRAVTRARVLDRFGTPAAAALLDCWLETGRTHQIRVHMAHLGHPLVGDQTYGARRKLAGKSFAATPDAVSQTDAFPRQALHAATLGFSHPVTQTWLEFSAQIPDDMQNLVNLLSG